MSMLTVAQAAEIEALACHWSLGALVNIRDLDGFEMVRPAAFVFASTHGITWVEPSYADPHGASSPSTHEALGTACSHREGFQVVRPDGRAYTFLPNRSVSEPDGDPSLVWFARHLEVGSTTWSTERRLVRVKVLGTRFTLQQRQKLEQLWADSQCEPHTQEEAQLRALVLSDDELLEALQTAAVSRGFEDIRRS